MAYEPREDSFLIQKHIAKFAKGKVLDMGTGSGIQAIEATKTAESVLAVDIDTEAVKTAKKNCKECKNIIIKKSDLFSNVKKQIFDLIIFNPPYLPDDKMAKDIALDGGKHGYELTQRFIEGAGKHLKDDGKILLLFSSLTNKDKIDQILKKNLFTFFLLDRQKFSFEELYIYLIAKTKDLIELEKLNIGNVRYLTKGKRGYIYTGIYNKKKVAVKIKNPDSMAQNKIQIEAENLKKLEPYGFSPKVLFFNDKILVYEFIKGIFIIPFIEKNTKKKILTIIKKLLGIMCKLDELKLQKEEMHHPLKHIIIDSKLNIKLVDFERMKTTEKPSNVTQFCQFLLYLRELLAGKEIIIDRDEMISLTKKYKETYSKEHFNKILEIIK